MEHKSIRQIAADTGLKHPHILYILRVMGVKPIGKGPKGSIYDTEVVLKTIEKWKTRSRHRCIRLRFISEKYRIDLQDLYRLCRDREIDIYILKREGMPNERVIMRDDYPRLQRIIEGEEENDISSESESSIFGH